MTRDHRYTRSFARRTVIHMSPTPAFTAPADVTARPLEPYLAQLAHLIAEHGVHAFEGDIARFVVRLRAVGDHSPAVSALLAVLSDRSAAPVARERAFGHLLCIVLDGTTRGPLTQTASTEDCCTRDAA